MNKDRMGGHFSAVELTAYVRDELTEQERDVIEGHIADCEPCMTLFMSAVEAIEAAEQEPAAREAGTTAKGKVTVPVPDMKKLGQRVIDVLLAELARSKPVMRAEPARRQSFLQRPAVHFAAAAAITLLLLGTGTFSGISEKLGELDADSIPAEHTIEKGAEQPQGPTWSDRMVTRTSSWFDKLEKDRFK
ncbi:zf-HC2 domain-containing protein [Paenibacillus glycanilyticus]|uniref:zf-HC2 domain-containing protein n=1 Tax=Paenibacillus glycanilyticus TaxID=126569 RepID=UPI00203DD95D|nr:zf-HC2 domain-containing protein [Paenibacillus glycanilyticus]MCM3631573.1 zf-HC2 domain-containing protein [Paenibacillus glycanilyticus]